MRPISLRILSAIALTLVIVGAYPVCLTNVFASGQRPASGNSTPGRPPLPLFQPDLLRFDPLHLRSSVPFRPNAQTSHARASSFPSSSSLIFVQAPAYVSGDQYADGLASGDLNGDGKPDLVVSNQGSISGSLGVLIANGDGSFQPVQTYSTGGPDAFSVAVADVNADGKLDLIAANDSSSAGTIAVLLGNGDGTFQPAQTFGSGGIYTRSLAVGDVNGDGKADVVALNQCADSTCSASSAGVLLGDGDGTFQPAQSYGTGQTNSISIALGDLNGDGKPDLVLAGLASMVSVLLNNGDGTFPAAQFYASGGNVATAVVLADINNDGKSDLLVSNQCSSQDCFSGVIGVLLGNGDGSFQNAQAYPANAQYSTSIALGDLNGDGKVDVAVTGAFNITLLFGNGDGSFQTGQSYSAGSGGSTAAAVMADLNGQGKAGLAVANLCSDSSCAEGDVTILLGNGDGTLQAVPAYATNAQNASFVATGDFNGDGKSDFAVAGSANASSMGVVSVFLGNRDGTVKPSNNYSSGGTDATWIAVGDVNADGKQDLVVANSATVGVLLGNGDGSFQPAQLYPIGGISVTSVAIADVNGDTKPDLLVTTGWADSNLTSGLVSVFLGIGDGTFQSGQTYSSGGLYAYSLAVADLNHDGKADLVVSNNCVDSTCSNGDVAVFLGNGDGTFVVGNSYSSAGHNTVDVSVGDLNADGNPDIAVSNYDGSVAILLGNGDGTLRPAQIYSTGLLSPNRAILEDVNGDGNQDVFLSGGGNDTALLLGNGDGTLQTATFYAPGGLGAALGDMNGDGKPDLIVASYGSVAVLLNVSVVPTTTTTTLVSSANPSSYNQPVTFTATVSASQGTPTGSVNFYDGTNLLGTGTLNNGAAAVTTQPLALGSHSITASYSGDTHFSGSASTPLNQVVNQASTTTALMGAPNPSSYNQTVTIVATVAAQFGGPLTGTVTFFDGTSVLSQSGIVGTTATLTISTLTPGTHSITAQYSGDSNFAGSTSSLLSQQVNKATTTATLTSSANPVVVKSPVTFTATVTGQFGGAATGSVSFMNGAKVIGTSPVSGNAASFTITFVTAGARSINAVYSGDANFSGSTSSTLTQQVSKAASSVTLSSSQNPSTVGQAVTFSATVASSLPVPNGETVNFLDGATIIATKTTASGVAKFTTSSLAHGIHQIKAQYVGDSNIKPATSPVLKQKVN